MAPLPARCHSLVGQPLAAIALLLGLMSITWSGCSGGAAPEAETDPAGVADAAPDGEVEIESDDAAEMAADETPEVENQPPPPGEAPFDTTYLDIDTELFVHARLAEILGSSLVQTLTGGQLGLLDQLKNDYGIDPRHVTSVTIGVGDLAALSERGIKAMNSFGPGMPPGVGPGAGRGRPSGLGRDSEMNADAEMAVDPEMAAELSVDPAMELDDSGEMPAADRGRGSGDNAAPAGQRVIAVIRTSTPIDIEGLEGDQSERVPHGDKAFYRVKDTSSEETPCLFVADANTLIIADETSLRSIIDEGPERPRPTADLGFVKTLPHLLVAVAPQDKSKLMAQDEGGARASHGRSADDRESPEYETPDAEGLVEIEPEMEMESGRRSGRGRRGEVPEFSFDQKLLQEHANASALLIDLSQGIGIDLAIRCDSPESAGAVQREVDKALQQLRQQFTAASDALPGIVQQIAQPVVDSLAAGTNESVVTVSTKFPEEKQATLALLPMALMGMMMSGGLEMDNELEQMASRRELAQKVIDQGQTATNTDELPDGLELKGLARWGESPYGDQAPPPLELALVALKGPAAQAVGFGKITLTEALQNSDAQLKWIGAAVEPTDGDALHGFVKIERDGMFSEHPDEGIATGILLAPPATTAGSLQSVAGQLMLQVAGQTEDILIPNLVQLPGGSVEEERLAAAQMSVNTRQITQGQLEVAWTESPLIGKIELITADGSPVEVAASNWSRTGGRKTMTFSLAGPPPSDLALRVVTYSNLQEVAVPFRFENLPVPQPPELNEQQQALLVWTRAETPEDHPDLIIEAQGRWQMPEPIARLQRPSMARQFGSDFDSGLPEDSGRRSRKGRDEEMMEAMTPPPSEEFSSQGEAGRLESPRTAASEEPLRIVIDLIGPLALAAEAIGEIDVTSVKTDIDTDLIFEGADVTAASGDPVDDFVDIDSDRQSGVEVPPDGLRVIVNLTPPNQAISGLTQLNGSLKLRTVRERTEAILNDLQSRVGQPEGNPPIAAKPVSHRELIKFGLKPVVAIETNRVMMRLLEGKDERISEVSLIDLNGLPITDVDTSVREGTGNARGRTVYAFEFPNGVPQKVGMKISVNMGVKDIEIPIRLRDLPLPPMPQDTAPAASR